MRVILISLIAGALLYSLNFLRTAHISPVAPEGIEGINLTICGYVTRQGFECLDGGAQIPQGRAWIRLLSEKPILKQELTASLYVILDGKRNEIASRTFKVVDPYRFRTFVDLNRMGHFVIVVSDPELGVLAEAYTEIIHNDEIPIDN